MDMPVGASTAKSFRLSKLFKHEAKWQPYFLSANQAVSQWERSVRDAIAERKVADIRAASSFVTAIRQDALLSDLLISEVGHHLVSRKMYHVDGNEPTRPLTDVRADSDDAMMRVCRAVSSILALAETDQEWDHFKAEAARVFKIIEGKAVGFKTAHAAYEMMEPDFKIMIFSGAGFFGIRRGANQYMTPAYWSAALLREILTLCIRCTDKDARSLLKISSSVLFGYHWSADALRKQISANVDERQMILYFSSSLHDRLSVLSRREKGDLYRESEALRNILTHLPVRLEEFRTSADDKVSIHVDGWEKFSSTIHKK